MNTIYYTLTSNNIGINYTSLENIIVSKGETELVLKLSENLGIAQTIIKVEVDFGDESPTYERNYTFNEADNILDGLIKHVYYPDPDTTHSNIIYYPTIVITYSNFKQLTFQLTIKIAKSSVFSDYKSVVVSSIQFVDDEYDSIFAVLESFSGDILNLKIK